MIDGEHTRYGLTPLFCAAACFLIAAPVFWMQVESAPGRPVSRDVENAGLFQRVAPSVAYGFGRLRQGELPLWNDRQFCGVPFQVDPANGVFQPLNIVMIWLPPGKAMVVQAFTSLFLMGAFFTLFGRALGLRYVPALAGGVVYAFNASSAAAMSRPELASTLAFTPLLLWAVVEHTRKPRLAVALLGGAAWALMLLGGAPALALLMTFVAVVLGVVRAWVSSRTGVGGRRTPAAVSPWPGLFCMVAVGLLLSALQWMPTLAWCLTLDEPWQALFRADPAGLTPRGWRELVLHLASPRPDLLPRLGYVGAAALALAPVAWWRRDRLLESAVFTGMALLFCFLGAHGAARWDGPFPWALCFLPASFALAVLTALALDRVFEARRDSRTPRLWMPLLAAAAITLVLFYLVPAEAKGRLLPVGAAILFFAVVRRPWAGALGGALVALFLFVDLSSASTNAYHHPYQQASSGGGVAGDQAKILREQVMAGRLLVNAHSSMTPVISNLGMVQDLSCAGGAMTPLSRDLAQWWRLLGKPGEAKDQDAAGRIPAVSMDYPYAFLDGPNAGLLRFMSVRAVLETEGGAFDFAHPAAPGWQQVSAQNGLMLYTSNTALPHAWLVRRWRVAPDMSSTAAALCQEDFDPARECVVQPVGQTLNHLAMTLPEGREQEDSPGGQSVEGTASVLASGRPERVVVMADTPRPALLVLADTFAPGWIASVNGAPAPLLKVNGLFRGVTVPAGKSEVVFRYRPLSVYAGVAVSLVTVGLLALSGVIALIRWPKQQQAQR